MSFSRLYHSNLPVIADYRTAPEYALCPQISDDERWCAFCANGKVYFGAYDGTFQGNEVSSGVHPALCETLLVFEKEGSLNSYFDGVLSEVCSGGSPSLTVGPNCYRLLYTRDDGLYLRSFENNVWGSEEKVLTLSTFATSTTLSYWEGTLFVSFVQDGFVYFSFGGPGDMSPPVKVGEGLWVASRYLPSGHLILLYENVNLFFAVFCVPNGIDQIFELSTPTTAVTPSLQLRPRNRLFVVYSEALEGFIPKSLQLPFQSFATEPVEVSVDGGFPDAVYWAPDSFVKAEYRLIQDGDVGRWTPIQ